MPVAIPQQPSSLELQPIQMHQDPKHNAPAPQHTNQPVKMTKEGSEGKNPSRTTQPKKQPATPPSSQSHMKKMSISRKTSKPIINWFQRKLAGTRTRRASDGDALRNQRMNGARSPSMKDKNRRSSVPAVPPLPTVQTSRKSVKGPKPRPNSIAAAKPNTISLNGSDDFSSINDSHTVDSSDDYRSLARESTWSPTSVREADEDASVRPLPPSSPPSPSPSHSSSSYLSDPRTFASMAASTKPTTLLSVDLNGGMAHIAQAPPTPTTLSHRINHTRTHSTTASTGGSITFSSLSPTSTSSRPTSTAQLSRSTVSHPTVNAPQHTTHHPRNNPRPSSPPPDDASVLTLASSAFAIPGARIGANALVGRASLAGDSISRFSGTAGLGDSTSHFLSGELDGDDDRLLMEGDRDEVDASVRALRPRSSRRSSWESEASGWSAGAGRPSTPSVLVDRSFTGGSYRTGGRSVDMLIYEEDDTQEMQGECEKSTQSASSIGLESMLIEDISVSPPSSDQRTHRDDSSLTLPAEKRASSPQLTTSSVQTAGETVGVSTPGRDRCQDTPKVTSRPLEEGPPALPTAHTITALVDQDGFDTLRVSRDHDRHGIATSTDIFVSVPSSPTPL